MKLDGSCHCGGVRFQLNSPHPYPFNLCYCSICRKTAGGGGYSINIAGEYSSLKVEGEENLGVYRAVIENKETGEHIESEARRHFCKGCGSALWLWDPRWPELVHPLASAIDTELPVPPEHTHLMVASKASWVELHKDALDKEFDEYPDESISAWHERLGLSS